MYLAVESRALCEFLVATLGSEADFLNGHGLHTVINLEEIVVNKLCVSVVNLSLLLFLDSLFDSADKVDNPSFNNRKESCKILHNGEEGSAENVISSRVEEGNVKCNDSRRNNDKTDRAEKSHKSPRKGASDKSAAILCHKELTGSEGSGLCLAPEADTVVKHRYDKNGDSREDNSGLHSALKEVLCIKESVEQNTNGNCPGAEAEKSLEDKGNRRAKAHILRKVTRKDDECRRRQQNGHGSVKSFQVRVGICIALLGAVIVFVIFIHSLKSSYAYISLLYIIAEKRRKNKSKSQNK